MVGKLQFVLMTLLLNATALTATAQEKATEQPSVPPTSAGAPTEQPAPAPAMTTPASSAAAEPAAPQEFKSLDQDVQSLKKEVLDLNRELFTLEEELLFPANTQVAVFVSI